ncbi:MAG: hypothetical protein SFT68_00415 [Rickettsiaceae bacterium]|nr:hypothetical protein [Rickettsiaceae bacterium]
MKTPTIQINYLKSFSAIALFCLLFADSAFAVNLDAAATAVFDPIIQVIDAHYSKAIFASGLVGAAVTPGGDLRSKAVGMGVGCLLSGLAVVAIKASLGI